MYVLMVRSFARLICSSVRGIHMELSLPNYVYAEGRFTDETLTAPRVVVWRKFKGVKLFVLTHNLARHTARFRISLRDNLTGLALKIEVLSWMGTRSAAWRNGYPSATHAYFKCIDRFIVTLQI
jgi:hypothetical protein